MSKSEPESAFPKGLLEALGKVTVYFSHLESSLESAIDILLVGNVSTEHRTSQIVTADLTFRNKIRLFESLYRHRFPTKTPFTELEEVSKDLCAANDKRNDLAHSKWLISGKKINIKVRGKKGFRLNFEDMSAAQIDEMANFIGRVNVKVIKFFFNF